MGKLGWEGKKLYKKGKREKETKGGGKKRSFLES